MGQQYSTGPAHLFVGTYNSLPGSAIYLGTAEEAPEIDVQSREQGAKASQGGVAIDFDTADQGEECFVNFILTRWNETVLLNVITMPIPSSALAGAATHGPGTYIPGDMGTLAMLEQQGITLFIQFPYSSKPAMIAGGPSGAGGPLRPGYRLPFAKKTFDNYPRNGTMAFAVAMAYHCRRHFNPATTSPYGSGGFTLYDFNVQGLPGTN